jgi:hypothetical protein
VFAVEVFLVSVFARVAGCGFTEIAKLCKVVVISEGLRNTDLNAFVFSVD